MKSDPPKTLRSNDASDASSAPDAPDASDASPPARPRGSFAWRAKLVAQRFVQPTGACLACMPGSLVANLPSLAHWEIALRTGVGTGALVLLLSLTPFARVFRDRYGNALVVGTLTAVGDAWSHPDHYGHGFVEPIVTGAVSAALSLVVSWLFEDRARRLRSWWARLRA